MAITLRLSIITIVQYTKKKLLPIAQKVIKNQPLAPDEISYLSSFQKVDKQSAWLKWLKRLALPASLVLGFIFSAFPKEFARLISSLPTWTNLSPPLLTGIDYLWDLIGDPVRKPNLIYHIPNIVLYGFGIFGIKKLVELVDKRTWLDKVLAAQTQQIQNTTYGLQPFSLTKGHSILFVGNGDFIGTQFALNHAPSAAVTVSTLKPAYSVVWNQYDVNTLYEDLKTVLIRAGGENAGEYIFFPVKDDQIFLPGPASYDLSPHKLDIICQDIRMIEKELKWKPRRILIIGDRTHQSFVQSEDAQRVIPQSQDTISLESITRKYPNTSLLDPSDIVLKKVTEIASGRKVVFRATKEGLSEYKERFYTRLEEICYHRQPRKEGILTIGYDLFEDQTEQQTLARTIDDLGVAASSAYFPIVLSKNVRDALIRNGYKKSEFLYVPELVLQTLRHEANKQ